MPERLNPPPPKKVRPHAHFGATIFLLVFAVPSIAAGAEPPPDKAAPAPKPANADKSGPAFDFTATALGAFDTNIFDKGAKNVQAVGADVTLGANLGMPLSKRLSWIGGAGLGTNYRDGTTGSVGDSNAMRVDAHVKTGVEALLLGNAALPGRKVKDPIFPAIKLALEAKYALWANPLMSQPAAQADETVDALEPTEDVEAEEASESEGEEGEEGEGSGASVPVGAQTFSNPNTHHKVTALLRAGFELSKALTLGADVAAGRDIVKLEDNVEVSPEYNEVVAGAAAKYKLSPKLLWLSAGYVFERRIYDELAASGLPQDFSVQGGKLGIDVPLKPVKFKLTYDARLKLADSGSNANTTRHQVSLAIEVPITKVFSAVVDTRYSYTVLNNAPDSTRFIGLAGLKVAL